MWITLSNKAVKCYLIPTRIILSINFLEGLIYFSLSSCFQIDFGGSRFFFSEQAPVVSQNSKIIRLNGSKAFDLMGTDKSELHEFLWNSGINIKQMNISLPREYMEKGAGEIIDGQVMEITNNPRFLFVEETDNK